MKAEDYSIGDLNRYLRRAAAFAEVKGEKVPVYITQIDRKYTEDHPNDGLIVAKVHLQKEKSTDWEGEKIVDIPFDKLDLSPIPIGCYNYKDQVIHVIRGAERQWNMAINTTSYACKVCNRDNTGAMSPSILNPSTLKSISNNTYYPVDLAVAKIREGKRYTVALSDKIWVGVDRFSENLLLGYKASSIVGLIKPDNSVIVFEGFEFLMETITQVTPVGGIEHVA